MFTQAHSPASLHAGVAAVPWRILVSEGHTVVFATEHGTPAQADTLLLHPTGLVLKKLAAEMEPRQFYAGTCVWLKKSRSG